MILALSGVTGVGKSFFKDKLVERLNFKKVNTIRTREIRKNESVALYFLLFRLE